MSNPSIPCSSDILPQHDLDERKRLGRQIGLENAQRSQAPSSRNRPDEVRLIEEARLLGYNAGYDDCWRDLKGWETLGR